MKPINKPDQKIATEEGLTVTKTEPTRSSHIRIEARNSLGQEAFFICPSTPSDYRGLKNKRAEFRRFARGISPQPCPAT